MTFEEAELKSKEAARALSEARRSLDRAQRMCLATSDAFTDLLSDPDNNLFKALSGSTRWLERAQEIQVALNTLST